MPRRTHDQDDIVVVPPGTEAELASANLAAIVLLATGLVLATTCVVAVVAHWATARTAVPLSWPACFVLGAIVSPTDAVAATAIFHRLGVPRRLMVVLEGESLVNDATALILYTTALAFATGDGTPFSPGLSVGHFIMVGVGRVGIGLAVGWAIAGLRGGTYPTLSCSAHQLLRSCRR
jgi:CPA1 family monovalent cation:H+ antiporter